MSQTAGFLITEDFSVDKENELKAAVIFGAAQHYSDATYKRGARDAMKEIFVSKYDMKSPDDIIPPQNLFTHDLFCKEEVRAFNQNRTWVQAMDQEKAFYSPWTSIPKVPESVKFFDVLFTTENQSNTHADLIKNTNMDADSNQTAAITLSLTKAQLKKSFLENLPTISSSWYHLLVMKIELLDIHSTFPIPMSMEFQSFDPENPNNTREIKNMVPWCKNTTVNSTTPDGTAYIVKSNQKWCQPEHISNVFWEAPSSYLSPDCTRWLYVDYNVLRGNLARTEDTATRPNIYRILCPASSDDCIFPDLIFQFILEEWPEIKHRTDIYFKKNPQLIHAFTTVNTRVKSSHSTYLHIMRPVLDEMLDEKEILYNKAKCAMSLDMMCVKLRPLTGNWHDYTNIIERVSGSLSGAMDDPAVSTAQFLCKLRIHYDAFQSRGNPQTQTNNTLSASMNAMNPFSGDNSYAPVSLNNSGNGRANIGGVDINNGVRGRDNGTGMLNNNTVDLYNSGIMQRANNITQVKNMYAEVNINI